MSLDLDKRQRAMLREMGIRLWHPQPAAADPASVVAPPDAPNSVDSALPSAGVPSQSNVPPSRQRPVESVPAQAASSAPAPPNAANPSASHSTWSLGEVHTLYAKPSADDGQPTTALGAAARWLLLIETPPGAAATDPLAGDVGKLLNNMLRATGLHNSAGAVCVPLSRRVDAVSSAPLGAALAELLKAEQPDVVLIMGRLAAQALLQSTEPLGKLRGRVHRLAGFSAVVTYDAAYLLRSLPDKAKAWDDLCLALHIAHRAGSSD
jgi:uracil-DNA glycosylase family 4